MLRSLLPFVLGFVPIAVVGVAMVGSDDDTPSTTLLIVRHAERTDDSANSDLSPAGAERAKALVEVAREAGVTAVYSTRFCRTAQTAQPLASALGLPITVQPVGRGLDGCAPAIAAPTNALAADVDSPRGLIAHILAAHPGEAVVVVGHSDTVPQLLAAAGRGAFDPVSIDGEYDNLFVVTVGRPRFAPRLVKARYGPNGARPR